MARKTNYSLEKLQCEKRKAEKKLKKQSGESQAWVLLTGGLKVVLKIFNLYSHRKITRCLAAEGCLPTFLYNSLSLGMVFLSRILLRVGS